MMEPNICEWVALRGSIMPLGTNFFSKICIINFQLLYKVLPSVTYVCYLCGATYLFLYKKISQTCSIDDANGPRSSQLVRGEHASINLVF